MGMASTMIHQQQQQHHGSHLRERAVETRAENLKNHTNQLLASSYHVNNQTASHYPAEDTNFNLQEHQQAFELSHHHQAHTTTMMDQQQQQMNNHNQHHQVSNGQHYFVANNSGGKPATSHYNQTNSTSHHTHYDYSNHRANHYATSQHQYALDPACYYSNQQHQHNYESVTNGTGSHTQQVNPVDHQQQHYTGATHNYVAPLIQSFNQTYNLAAAAAYADQTATDYHHVSSYQQYEQNVNYRQANCDQLSVRIEATPPTSDAHHSTQSSNRSRSNKSSSGDTPTTTFDQQRHASDDDVDDDREEEDDSLDAIVRSAESKSSSRKYNKLSSNSEQEQQTSNSKKRKKGTTKCSSIEPFRVKIEHQARKSSNNYLAVDNGPHQLNDENYPLQQASDADDCATNYHNNREDQQEKRHCNRLVSLNTKQAANLDYLESPPDSSQFNSCYSTAGASSLASVTVDCGAQAVNKSSLNQGPVEYTPLNNSSAHYSTQSNSTNEQNFEDEETAATLPTNVTSSANKRQQRKLASTEQTPGEIVTTNNSNEFNQLRILEMRKEKSRDAARSRRSKENHEFYELAKLLPLPAAITSQLDFLDKASIIRLTISFLKLRQFSVNGHPPWAPDFTTLGSINPYSSHTLTSNQYELTRPESVSGHAIKNETKPQLFSQLQPPQASPSHLLPLEPLDNAFATAADTSAIYANSNHNHHHHHHHIHHTSAAQSVPLMMVEKVSSSSSVVAKNAARLFDIHQGTHILQSLDGFAFAIGRDGRFLYISETVSMYLGLSQVEMTGSSVFDYTHQQDHEELARQLGIPYSASSEFNNHNNNTTTSNCDSPPPASVQSQYSAASSETMIDDYLNNNDRQPRKKLKATAAARNTNSKAIVTTNNKNVILNRQQLDDELFSSSANDNRPDASHSTSNTDQQQPSNGTTEDPLVRQFCIRMKSTLTKRGCQHFKSSGYRVVHVVAHLRSYQSNDHGHLMDPLDESTTETTSSSAPNNGNSDCSPSAAATATTTTTKQQPAARRRGPKPQVGKESAKSNVKQESSRCKSSKNSNGSDQSVEPSTSTNDDNKTTCTSNGPTSVKQQQQKIIGMVAVAIALPPPSINELRLESDTFVLRLGLDLRITHIEPKITELLKYPIEALAGRSLYSLVHPADVHQVQKCHRDLLRKGQMMSGYYRLLARTGGYIWIQTCATLICNNTLTSQFGNVGSAVVPPSGSSPMPPPTPGQYNATACENLGGKSNQQYFSNSRQQAQQLSDLHQPNGTQQAAATLALAPYKLMSPSGSSHLGSTTTFDNLDQDQCLIFVNYMITSLVDKEDILDVCQSQDCVATNSAYATSGGTGEFQDLTTTTADPSSCTSPCLAPNINNNNNKLNPISYVANSNTNAAVLSPSTSSVSSQMTINAQSPGRQNRLNHHQHHDDNSSNSKARPAKSGGIKHRHSQAKSAKHHHHHQQQQQQQLQQQQQSAYYADCASNENNTKKSQVGHENSIRTNDDKTAAAMNQLRHETPTGYEYHPHAHHHHHQQQQQVITANDHHQPPSGASVYGQYSAGQQQETIALATNNKLNTAADSAGQTATSWFQSSHNHQPSADQHHHPNHQHHQQQASVVAAAAAAAATGRNLSDVSAVAAYGAVAAADYSATVNRYKAAFGLADTPAAAVYHQTASANPAAAYHHHQHHHQAHHQSSGWDSAAAAVAAAAAASATSNLMGHHHQQQQQHAPTNANTTSQYSHHSQHMEPHHHQLNSNHHHLHHHPQATAAAAVANGTHATSTGGHSTSGLAPYHYSYYDYYRNNFI